MNRKLWTIVGVAAALMALAPSGASAAMVDPMTGLPLRVQDRQAQARTFFGRPAQSTLQARPFFGRPAQVTRPARPSFGRPAQQASIYARPAPVYQSSPIPRETVSYRTNEPAGSIIISTKERRLYYILGDGMALRYGIGVGRDGFQWGGVKRVTRKAEWPSWRPPAQMRRRQPYLPVYMPGGPRNPLGARAIYLGSSLYRIHGSNEPHTIGRAVSSGCFRMTNSDVIDLYERVKVGAKVVVLR